jgi:dynein heavy chain
MIYTNISRGLFEKDKIIYSFLITTSIKKELNLIDLGVWNILLRGPTVFTSSEKAGLLDSPDDQMLNTISWETLCSVELRSKGQFEGLTAHVTSNWDAWKKWARTDMPYTNPMPGEYEEKCSYFDKLTVVKAFRNEMITMSLSEYINHEMGKFYVESPSTAMEVIGPQLNTVTPLIFVLT